MNSKELTTPVWVTRQFGRRWQQIAENGTTLTLKHIGGAEQQVTLPRREVERVARRER